MRGMRRNGDADREIPARDGEIRTPLVASPIEKQLLQRDPAHELDAVFAVGHEKYVVFRHRAADAGLDRLLAQQGRESAELAGALQGDRLGVVGAHQHHPAVERDQRLRIAREFGQRLDHLAVRVEELRVVDFEFRDDGHWLRLR